MPQIMLLERIHTLNKREIMFGNLFVKFQRGYVSEIDQFLQELNNMPGIKSTARIEEEQKYKRIFALRDVSKINIPEELPWKEF